MNEDVLALVLGLELLLGDRDGRSIRGPADEVVLFPH